MSDGTSIEWTDASWNPLRAFRGGGAVTKHGWACVRVSQGCVNCYAATINMRLGTGLDYTVPALAKVETYLDMDALEKPLHWRKSRRVFVCSMTDLFGDWVTDSEIAEVFGVMARARQHTFQVLTKRPERMRHWITNVVHFTEGLPNVWLGTSVEDQAAADARIPELLATPATVRFLSCEPLLGPLDLNGSLANCEWCGHHQRGRCAKCSCEGIGLDYQPAVDWVIVGGESGPRARPMDLAWARSLVAQCKVAGVAVFVKQLGTKPLGRTVVFEPVTPGMHRGGWAAVPLKLRDRKGGDMAEWPDDLRVREFA